MSKAIWATDSPLCTEAVVPGDPVRQDGEGGTMGLTTVREGRQWGRHEEVWVWDTAAVLMIQRHHRGAIIRLVRGGARGKPEFPRGLGDGTIAVGVSWVCRIPHHCSHKGGEEQEEGLKVNDDQTRAHLLAARGREPAMHGRKGVVR
jgi:hypothetical protein